MLSDLYRRASGRADRGWVASSDAQSAWQPSPFLAGTPHGDATIGTLADDAP